MICSSVVTTTVTVKDLKNRTVVLERMANGVINLHGKIRIVKSDVIATNGVIQVVESIILPKSGTKGFVFFRKLFRIRYHSVKDSN